MKRILLIAVVCAVFASQAFADDGSARAVTKAPVAPKVIDEKGSAPVVRSTPQPEPQVIIQQPVVRPQQQPRPMPQPVMQPAPVMDTPDVQQPCAQDSISRMANSANYLTKFCGQFLRGLINAATCWIELPRSIYEDSRDGAPFIGTFQGIGYGAAYTIMRAAGGCIDVATAIIPNYYNDIYYSHDEPIIFCKVTQ